MVLGFSFSIWIRDGKAGNISGKDDTKVNRRLIKYLTLSIFKVPYIIGLKVLSGFVMM